MAGTKRQVTVGRPARISRADVAEAALAIGLDSVTLTSVGERLGVNHSSLYRHVKGRDDLLLAAADLAIEQLDWESDTGDWRTYLESIAEAVWELYARHPGLANAIRMMDATPPAGIRAFSSACRRLEAFGFSSEDAVLIMDSIMDMTNDSSSGWQRMASPAEHGGTVGESIQRSWDMLASDGGAILSHIALMSAVISGDPKDWWRRKLALLLDGAAAMCARQGPSPKR